MYATSARSVRSQMEMDAKSLSIIKDTNASRNSRRVLRTRGSTFLGEFFRSIAIQFCFDEYNDFVYYKATWNKRGIIVHSLTDQIPADDFAGRIVETVISLTNEEKRRQTSRDVKRGLKSLVSKGFSAGPPPRRYRAVKVTIGEKRDGLPRVVSKWEPNAVLSEYVEIAWQLRAREALPRDYRRDSREALFEQELLADVFRKQVPFGYRKERCSRGSRSS